MSLVVKELPSRGAFADQINSLFVVQRADGTTVGLRLTQVDPHQSSPLYDSFSLVFQAPPDLPSAQSVFNLSHDAIGEMDLLLVPIKKDENGLYLEAVINRLIA